MSVDSAFNLTFSTWPPPDGGVRHGIAAPIGSIRYGKKGKSTHRLIKVRLTGRFQDRWMNLARFWWIKNKGPVPEGKRVGHLDGNSLNDDPANYALFTPGDVIASWHIDNPEKSDRQHRRAGLATGEANRARAHAARMLGQLLPTRWYPVDLSQRLIYNAPRRMRWQIYQDFGFPVPQIKNGRVFVSAALGFPQFRTHTAAIAAVLLAAGEPMSIIAIRNAACELLAPHGWRAASSISWTRSAMAELNKRGWITREYHRSGGFSRYSIDVAAATAERQRVCPIVAIRGFELDTITYRGFSRVLHEPTKEAA